MRSLMARVASETHTSFYFWDKDDAGKLPELIVRLQTAEDIAYSRPCSLLKLAFDARTNTLLRLKVEDSNEATPSDDLAYFNRWIVLLIGPTNLRAANGIVRPWLKPVFEEVKLGNELMWASIAYPALPTRETRRIRRGWRVYQMTRSNRQARARFS